MTNMEEKLIATKKEIKNAVARIDSLSFSVMQAIPERWSIQQVKEWLLNEIPENTVIGRLFHFGECLCGRITEEHIIPEGNTDRRLDIAISVRFNTASQSVVAAALAS